MPHCGKRLVNSRGDPLFVRRRFSKGFLNDRAKDPNTKTGGDHMLIVSNPAEEQRTCALKVSPVAQDPLKRAMDILVAV